MGTDVDLDWLFNLSKKKCPHPPSQGESKIFKNTFFTMYYPSTHNTGTTYLSFSSYLFLLYPRTLNPTVSSAISDKNFSYPLLFPD